MTLQITPPTLRIVCLRPLSCTRLPCVPLCGNTQRPYGPVHLATELSRGETGPLGSLHLQSDKPGELSPPPPRTQHTLRHTNHGLPRDQMRRQLKPTPRQELHHRPWKPQRSRLQQVLAIFPSPILLLSTATHLQGQQEKVHPSARQLQKHLLQCPTPRRRAHHRSPTPR